MIKKICCLLAMMILIISCADKNKKDSINIIEDDEYIKNIVKDSSK